MLPLVSKHNTNSFQILVISKDQSSLATVLVCPALSFSQAPNSRFSILLLCNSESETDCLFFASNSIILRNLLVQVPIIQPHLNSFLPSSQTKVSHILHQAFHSRVLCLPVPLHWSGCQEISLTRPSHPFPLYPSSIKSKPDVEHIN